MAAFIPAFDDQPHHELITITLGDTNSLVDIGSMGTSCELVRAAARVMVHGAAHLQPPESNAYVYIPSRNPGIADRAHALIRRQDGSWASLTHQSAHLYNGIEVVRIAHHVRAAIFLHFRLHALHASGMFDTTNLAHRRLAALAGRALDRMHRSFVGLLELLLGWFHELGIDVNPQVDLAPNHLEPIHEYWNNGTAPAADLEMEELTQSLATVL